MLESKKDRAALQAVDFLIPRLSLYSSSSDLEIRIQIGLDLIEVILRVK
jgi:hypothetical protein